MAPEDDVTPGGYMIWRGNPAAILPPPALPEGRRSFGCTAMARPADLHRACGGLRHSVETAVAASAKIAKGSRREGRIPAGYTYLGQLLAHDLCAPAEGAFDYPLQGAAPAPAPSQRQSRAVPLHLETLFGPIALKRPLPGLHRFAPHPAFPMFAADINRVAPGDGSNARADLHDGRNDDSPMVAQLSALFVEAAHRAEAAFRQQGLGVDAACLAARAKVARLWHRILVQDYLPRLCLPGLPPPVADRTGPREVPVEVSHAILRMGHWMVRSQYTLAADTVPVRELLAGQSGIAEKRARPGLENHWRIDWRHFFELDPAVPPQRSLALQTGIAVMFGSDFTLPAGLRIHSALVRSDNDLALRDLARSIDGGVQRVSALARRLQGLRARYPHWVLWTASTRRAMIADWFAANNLKPVPALLRDPPLYLYALIEAGKGTTRKGFGGGRHLGALGSVLLGRSIASAIVAAKAALPADNPALPDLDAITTMPDLVRFLSQ